MKKNADNTVKGLVEIIKDNEESCEDYKIKITELLFELLASYGGLSKEVYANLPDWNPDKISKLEEEPSDDCADKCSDNFENRADFIEYHLANGWNKTFDLNIYNKPLQETIYGSSVDADDGDSIRWIRKTNGKTKYLNVYLLKYVDYFWMSDDGINLINGVMFAEKYNGAVYEKIKRVSTNFSKILKTKDLFQNACIEKPDFAEILQYSNGIARWIQK